MGTVKTDRTRAFEDVVKEIKEAGYDVYTLDDKWRKIGLAHYGYVTDGINISEVSVDYLKIIHFTSIHKPNAYIGSGFSMDRDMADSRASTIKEMVEISFRHLPKWGEKYRKHLKIYKDFEEFRKYKENYWKNKLVKL